MKFGVITMFPETASEAERSETLSSSISVQWERTKRATKPRLGRIPATDRHSRQSLGRLTTSCEIDDDERTDYDLIVIKRRHGIVLAFALLVAVLGSLGWAYSKCNQVDCPEMTDHAAETPDPAGTTGQLPSESTEERLPDDRTTVRPTRMTRAEVFYAHMDRVREFKCKIPVPAALAVSSLHDDISWKPPAGRVYHPDKTILHRCGEASGCCLDEEKACQAVGFEQVKLIFNVYDIQRKTWEFVETSATNHTLCECLEVLEDPK